MKQALCVLVILLAFSTNAEAEEIVPSVFPPAGVCHDGDTVVFRENPMRLECLSSGGGIPTGTVSFFVLGACPTGWLLANGSGGTLDLRGEFIRVYDAGRGLDAGRVLGSVQSAQMPDHKHQSTNNRDSRSNAWGLGPWTGVVGGYYDGWGSGQGNLTSGVVPATGLAVGAENRPRNISLIACIKS
jgi:hypothetical protein